MSAIERLRQNAAPPQANGEPPRAASRSKASSHTPSKAAGWWGVLSGFVDSELCKISPAAATVWLVMFRNSKRGYVCESHEQIASFTGMTDRHVRRCIAELTKAGLVSLLSKGNRAKGPSRYTLNTTGQIRPVEHHHYRTRMSDCYRTGMSYTPMNKGGGSLDATAEGKKRSASHE